VMTDRSTEINGSVSDSTGKPQAGLTVIAFSTDPQYWRAQSRRIQAVRTDQSGTFKLHGLPPGDYHLLAVDDAEQGEWFDPSYLEHIRPGAKRVSLSEGEAKTENLSAPQ
jgi:hypothetical protein